MLKLITAVFIVSAIVFLNSCKKNENTASYCAECVEQKSGYKPAPFCGTSSDVDSYIANLKANGSNVGQVWNCSKGLSK